MEPAKYLTHYRPVVMPDDPDKVVTLDFETFYDTKDGYSLKKMSIEAYVRDPRFRVFGLGVKRGSNQTHWIEGPANVERFFRKVPLNQYLCIAQNAPFEGLIMSHHYDVRPAAWLDTQAMCAMAYGNTVTSVSLDAMTKRFLPGHVKAQTDLFALDGVKNPTPDQLARLGVYCQGDCDKTYLLFAKFLPLLQQSPANSTKESNFAAQFVVKQSSINWYT